jgi:hypothetical protein
MHRSKLFFYFRIFSDFLIFAYFCLTFSPNFGSQHLGFGVRGLEIVVEAAVRVLVVQTVGGIVKSMTLLIQDLKVQRP